MTPGAVATDDAPVPRGDLQAVFATLARRAKLPTAADARPGDVLRTAGLPLLMAAVVAGAVSPAPAQAAEHAAGTAAGTDSWTVTPLAVPSPPSSSSAAPAPVAAPEPTLGAGTGRPSRPAVKPVHTSAAKPSGRPAVKGTAPKPPGKGAPRVTYTVRDGDTLSLIALRSGRDVQAIITLNQLRADGFVVPGQVLVLPDPVRPAPKPAPTKAAPTKATPTKAAPTKTAPAKAAPGRTAPGTDDDTPSTREYVVQAGDTLTDISRAQKVELTTILSQNHLRMDSLIHPGQKLLLPAPPTPKATAENSFLGRIYPPAVVAAANANRRALATRQVPTQAQTRALIVAEAKRQGVDPALALAVGRLESGFNQRMVSPANAVGVMQVIPSAGKWASSLVGRPLDLLSTRDNIAAGVALLHALVAAADNDAQAIAGYYQGLSSVRANGMYDDTRRYVANVQTLRARFAAELDPSARPDA